MLPCIYLQLGSLQYGHTECTPVMSFLCSALEKCGLMDNFQRQQSVWNLVKENVPCSELPEIRDVLGETLIDTYAELYSEVNQSYLCIRLSGKTKQVLAESRYGRHILQKITARSRLHNSCHLHSFGFLIQSLYFPFERQVKTSLEVGTAYLYLFMHLS